jgi:Ca2+-binding EF-hand superfamily protein
MRRTGTLAILVAAVLVGGGALAADNRPRDEVDQDLISRIGNRPLEAFLTEILAPIRNSADGKRLTRQEVEAGNRIRDAGRRASEINRFLRYDLDGDSSVTAEEIIQAIAGSPAGLPRPRDNDFKRGQAERTVHDLMRADDNGDGRVDFAEMTTQARLVAGRQGDGARTLNELILDLDDNGDGATTVQEAEDRARRVFGLYDRDGDGVIDDDARSEIAAMTRKAQERRRIEAAAASCIMPPAPAADRIVYFDAGRAQAVSSVAVGGTNGVTLTAPVTIERGDQPIYLVLSAPNDFLWRIEGAVERLDRVVLMQGRGSLAWSVAAGVTGVDASIVSFAERNDCTRMANTMNNLKGEGSAAIFRQVLGRAFDNYSYAEKFSAVSVPSLAVENDRLRIDENGMSCMRALREQAHRQPQGSPQIERNCSWIEAEMRFTYPSGLIKIDPAKVVARHAEAYDVLPSPFGYEQAVKDGTLIDVSEGRRTGFRIVKPLPHFPAMQLGARRLDFELAEGIQPPAGDAHSYCIRDSKSELVSGQARICTR